jgi:hypothetical protein
MLKFMEDQTNVGPSTVLVQQEHQRAAEVSGASLRSAEKIKQGGRNTETLEGSSFHNPDKKRQRSA